MIYGELIQSQTVGSGTPTTVQFTSIPATFTDIVAVCSARSSYASGYPITMSVQINGANIDALRTVYGGGTGVGYEGSSGADYVPSSSAYTGMFGSATYYFGNYASATPKNFFIDSATDGETASYIRLIAGMHNTTSAISSLTFTMNQGGFVQNSVISLYGATKGAGGATIS